MAKRERLTGIETKQILLKIEEASERENYRSRQEFIITYPRYSINFGIISCKTGVTSKGDLTVEVSDSVMADKGKSFIPMSEVYL